MQRWIVILMAAIAGAPSLGLAQQPVGYVARQTANAGAISGRVIYPAEVPAPRELDVTVDVEVCGQEPKFEEGLVVAAETAGLKNVVVWLSDITEGKGWDPESETGELNQINCRFHPHVLTVPVGQTFHVVNTDGILHNFHTRSSENRPVNKAHPRILPRLNIRFRNPDIVQVLCDVHGWMEAWIVVAAHPYYAVTGENGTFQLADVPSGTYTLNLWHETLGTQAHQVIVSDQRDVQVDLEYAPTR